MTLSEYVVKTQQIVDDTSDRMRAVIETSFHATYREVIQDVGKYLIDVEEVTETAVPDQRYFEPVTKFSRVKRVFYKATTATDYQELKKIPSGSFDPNLSSGIPTGYYSKENRLYFDRPAIDAGLVKMIIIPQQIEPIDDATDIIIDDKYQSVIINGTVAGALLYEGDAGHDQFAMKYMQEKQNMIEDYATRDKIDTPSLYV